MPSLGDVISSALLFLGPIGMIVALFLVFLVDSAIFPALPEVFAIAFFIQYTDLGWDPLQWAFLVFAAAISGEVAGNTLLYLSVKSFIVRKGRMPRRLERTMKKYVNFLLLKDERIILLNRVAPALPFVGAFTAVCNWNFRRAISYVVLGASLKYPVLLAFAGFFGYLYEPRTAQMYSLIMVIAVVAVSGVASWRIRAVRSRPR